METTTNFIVKPSEARDKLRIGEKFYMSNPMGGDDIMTIEKFEDGKVFIKGDKLVLAIPMTEKIDNLPDTEIVYFDKETGEKKILIVKAPRFRKAPELNQ